MVKDLDLEKSELVITPRILLHGERVLIDAPSDMNCKMPITVKNVKLD